MKKQHLKSLNLNKKSISNLSKATVVGGSIFSTGWASCYVCPVGDTVPQEGLPLETDEGPCHGGTSGCVV